MNKIRLWLTYGFLPLCRRTRENVAIWIAWNLPREIVYWCVIRVACHKPRDLTLDEFIGTNSQRVASLMGFHSGIERNDGR